MNKKQYFCGQKYIVMELSENQIKRQDFVDNATLEFINALIPSDKQLDWDIESIATVRDAVCKVLVEKQVCTEQEFYPFVKE